MSRSVNKRFARSLYGQLLPLVDGGVLDVRPYPSAFVGQRYRNGVSVVVTYARPGGTVASEFIRTGLPDTSSEAIGVAAASFAATVHQVLLSGVST